MRRIVGISVAAVLAVPCAIGSYGIATAGEQNVPARHSSGLLGSDDGGLLGLGGGDGDGLLGTGLLSSGDSDRKKERSKKNRKSDRRDRDRDRDHQANSIAGLDILGGGDDDGLLGGGGLLGTGLLDGGGDGLLGTGLLGGGDRERKRDRDDKRNGSKKHYDNRGDDGGSDLDDDDFPFGD